MTDLMAVIIDHIDGIRIWKRPDFNQLPSAIDHFHLFTTHAHTLLHTFPQASEGARNRSDHCRSETCGSNHRDLLEAACVCVRARLCVCVSVCALASTECRFRSGCPCQVWLWQRVCLRGWQTHTGQDCACACAGSARGSVAHPEQTGEPISERVWKSRNTRE